MLFALFVHIFECVCRADSGIVLADDAGRVWRAHAASEQGLCLEMDFPRTNTQCSTGYFHKCTYDCTVEIQAMLTVIGYNCIGVVIDICR